MANATPQRIGQVNQAGDTSALFMKVFTGEVFTAFEETCVTRDRIVKRTIPNGKTASFAKMGKLQAIYHVPGAEIVGQGSDVAETLISIDQQLIAPVFIAEIDEAMNHFDVRSRYSREAGLALAYAWDKNVLQMGIQAARSADDLASGPGGTVVIAANAKTSATDLAAAIYGITQAMDEKDVPGEDSRFVYVRPAQYYLLAQSTQILNRDWTAGLGGNYATGEVIQVAGCPIVKANHLPVTNVTAALAKYSVDASNTAALVMNEQAVGTVELIGMSTRMSYDERRLGTLMLSKHAVGHGILRPACAGEIRTA